MKVIVIARQRSFENMKPVSLPENSSIEVLKLLGYLKGIFNGRPTLSPKGLKMYYFCQK